MKRHTDIALGDVIIVCCICAALIWLLVTMSGCSSPVESTIDDEWPIDTTPVLDNTVMGVCCLCSYAGSEPLAVEATGEYCDELGELDDNLWVCAWAPYPDTL